MPVVALRETQMYTGAPSPTEAAPSSSSRVVSLDIVRGVVMVLMAIDHVRVYSGLPPGGPHPAIFFTRWITHFVAPAFLFASGVAYGASTMKRWDEHVAWGKRVRRRVQR